MKTSFGAGTIPLVFKDLPMVAAHYMRHLDDEQSFNGSLGGPVYRVTTPAEAQEVLKFKPDLIQEHPASKDHWEMCYFTNNSGGPTYVIPKDFVNPGQVALLKAELE